MLLITRTVKMVPLNKYHLLNSIFCSLWSFRNLLKLTGLIYLEILRFGRSLFIICYQLTILLPDNVPCFLYLSLEISISFSFLSFIENLLYAKPCMLWGIHRLMTVPVLGGVSILYTVWWGDEYKCGIYVVYNTYCVCTSGRCHYGNVNTVL